MSSAHMWPKLGIVLEKCIADDKCNKLLISPYERPLVVKNAKCSIIFRSYRQDRILRSGSAVKLRALGAHLPHTTESSHIDEFAASLHKPDIYQISIYRTVVTLNVKTLCLGFLSLREASGYEIKKELEEGMLSHFIEASFGSIYPALNQLAADGLVTVREEEQSGKPDKKVYSISPAGIARLGEWLSVKPARDKYKSEFLFEMLLQHHMAPTHRLAAIDTQLAHLREDMENIVNCKSQGPCDHGSSFVLGYGEAVLTAAVTYLEEKRKELTMTAPKVAAAE